MEDVMILSTAAVEKIFVDCLYKDDEITEGEVPEGCVKVEGIEMTVGFHPGRLEEHRDLITMMLAELPEEFKEGWSFLNACNDRHGNQWTSFHRAMDQLFMLGMAIGKVKCMAPRELWAVLPGGMPYYMTL
jgi:hypothetical protein